jgi:hypothetical protein
MPGPSEFHSRLESIEELFTRVESTADPYLRDTAEELVQMVMDLHGRGLNRVMEILTDSGRAGEEAIDALSRDELVSSLLALHGLQPRSLGDRVSAALNEIRPALKKLGGEAESVHVVDGAVKLKLQAKGHAASLKDLVEGVVYQAAPDISSLEIDDSDERPGFVPLAMLYAFPAANGKPDEY